MLRKGNLDLPFDLTTITEFPQALIYGFDPEASELELQIDEVPYLLFSVGQWQDMLNAYFYAQNTILAEIKQQGLASVTPAMILTWLNQLHLRIAETLASDVNVIAGQFTDQQVFRWEPSSEMRSQIVSPYLFDRLNLNEAAQLATQIGHKKQDTIAFLTLLKKLRDDKRIKPLPEDEKLIPYHSPRESVALVAYKLVAAMHRGNFKKEERELINKFVKIPPHPTQLVAKMQAFAEQLLEKWKQCDPQNTDQVAKLVTFTFIQITEIHPYFNGNGRVATCFLNVILRTLGKSAILVRNPAERNDPNSSYSIAICDIDAHPEKLKAHLEKRLEEKEQYHDPVLAGTIQLRVMLANCFKARLKSESLDSLNRRSKEAYSEEADKLIEIVSLPAQELQKIQQSMVEKFNIPRFNVTPSNVLKWGFVYGLSKMIDLFKPAQQAKAVLPAVVARQYSKEEVGTIITKLNAITENEWKQYGNEQAFFLTFPANSNEEADALSIQLQKLGVMDVQRKKNKATQQSVILVKNIRMDELRKVEVLPDVQVRKKVSVI